MPRSKRTDPRLWLGEQLAQTCGGGSGHRKRHHFLIDGAVRWGACQIRIAAGPRKGQVCGADLHDERAPYYAVLGRQPSKTAAADTKATAKTDLARGTFVNPAKAKLLVNDELARWLEHHHRPDVAANSFKADESVVRLHLYPRLEGVTLRECSHSRMQAMFSTWVADEGRRSEPMTKAKRFLTATFTIAERDGKIARNPMIGVKVPTSVEQRRRRSKRITAWTPAQVADFFAWLEDPYWTLFFTAARTGLRDSELCGLRIEDVSYGPCEDEGCDHTDAHLHVRQVRVRYPTGVVEAPPKSANSERAIPLVASLERELRAYRAAHPAIAGLFFTDTKGEGLSPMTCPSGSPAGSRPTSQTTRAGASGYTGSATASSRA